MGPAERLARDGTQACCSANHGRCHDGCGARRSTVYGRGGGRRLAIYPAGRQQQAGIVLATLALAAVLLPSPAAAQNVAAAPAAAAPAAPAPQPTASSVSAWQRYVESSGGPAAAAVSPSVISGLPSICECAVYSYASPTCQARAASHCADRAGNDAAGRAAFCNAILIPKDTPRKARLSGLAQSRERAASVADYLKRQCFSSSRLSPDADYCPCFKDPRAKECVLARLGLCSGGRSPSACAALTLGPDIIEARETDRFLTAARTACGLPDAGVGLVIGSDSGSGLWQAAARRRARRAAAWGMQDGGAPWVGPVVTTVVAVVAALCGGALLAAICGGCVWCHKRRIRQWQSKTLPRTYSDTSVYIPEGGDEDDGSPKKDQQPPTVIKIEAHEIDVWADAQKPANSPAAPAAAQGPKSLWGVQLQPVPPSSMLAIKESAPEITPADGPESPRLVTSDCLPKVVLEDYRSYSSASPGPTASGCSSGYEAQISGSSAGGGTSSSSGGSSRWMGLRRGRFGAGAGASQAGSGSASTPTRASDSDTALPDSASDYSGGCAAAKHAAAGLGSSAESAAAALASVASGSASECATPDCSDASVATARAKWEASLPGGGADGCQTPLSPSNRGGKKHAVSDAIFLSTTSRFLRSARVSTD